jgi:hypothetical protein
VPVYFVREGDRGVAVWRASDDAPDVFLCSVDLAAYSNEPQVHDRFAELVSVVADHFRRQHVAGAVDPAAWVAKLPCASCTSPLAADVLHRARQASDVSELELSPGGFPAGCCRRQVVAAFGSRPDAPRAAARR